MLEKKHIGAAFRRQRDEMLQCTLRVELWDVNKEKNLRIFVAIIALKKLSSFYRIPTKCKTAQAGLIFLINVGS